MKRKFSFILNIAIICLCVCAIAIGVWSAKHAQLAISGNIGFTANNCNANITIEVDGAASSLTSAPEDNWYIQNNGSGLAKTSSTIELINQQGNISFNNMFFSDLPDLDNPAPIVMTFTITNTSNFPIVAYLGVGDNLLGYDGIVIASWKDASTTLLVGETSYIKLTLTCNSRESFENLSITGADLNINFNQASILNASTTSETKVTTFTLSDVLTGEDLPEEESTTNWYNITRVEQEDKPAVQATANIMGDSKNATLLSAQ
ncbi:MAG: hypothetical protein E7378_01450 [Clostridiales bacterium]|nr:hypothetical protein [Clostridiales bacterium]